MPGQSLDLYCEHRGKKKDILYDYVVLIPGV